jgi:hypothetical protein
MKTFFFSRGVALIALTGLLILASNSSALACAACYGDTTGSRIGNAANWGIIAMVIIMFVMLGAVAAFGFYLAYRAKHPLPDYQELLGEDPAPPKPGTPT